ncbi:hypothetical protein PS15m_008692 [Mucor circinelloides]
MIKGFHPKDPSLEDSTTNLNLQVPLVRGLDDELTVEIVHLIEGLKGDNLNENVNQHSKKVNSALLLNDHKKQHRNKKTIPTKKLSELI